MPVVAEIYRTFAEREARGRSALYVELARGVAGDPELLALLAALPPAKRQPNLLFSAVQLLHGTPAGFAELRGYVLEHRDEVVTTVLARRTQTNEPARCATLLPLLARLPPPLALLEVGASAGLCLLIDRYGYDYGGHRVAPVQRVGAEPPVFSCRASPATPLPRGIDVAWRAGLDLEPVDVHDEDSVAWLEALVWPGEGDRLALLRQALAVARADPPRVVAGDLRRDLPALAAEAPRDATLVVFHTAVLSYVADPAERRAFARTVRALGATWVANEGPDVLTEPAGEPWPRGRFRLTCDGRPVAWTDPHGTTIDWLGGPPGNT
ncbi:MAG TPA: DUF2332 domain-containing protein [Solirubrobacteraceae bacterium]